MKLLLVEDDADLAAALMRNLHQGQIEAMHVQDALQARLALQDHVFDAVLLDLGLPDASGLSVLQRMRQLSDATPVLVITARDALQDRLKLLNAGADDYLVKPFASEELIARIHAVHRRVRGEVAKTYRFETITLDPWQHTVKQEGRPVNLTEHEYRLLLALMQNPTRALTRDQLLQTVYPDALEPDSNTLAVYIHALRRKLGAHVVATVHGYGYKLGREKHSESDDRGAVHS